MRVFTGISTDTSRSRSASGSCARRGGSRRELVVVDSSLQPDVPAEEWQERILNDGTRWEVYKRYFDAGGARRRARRRQHRLRRSLVRRRPLLTRRRSRYRSIASLQRDNRVCRACAEEGFPLESLPIVQPYEGQRAYVFGQAPGVVEGQERRPWRGRAGRTLRRWLELDEDEFYATFYCASVTRCYPGKTPSGRGDRTPTPREQELCAFWREWELRLIGPELVVPVGGLAARRLLGLKSVTECVG